MISPMRFVNSLKLGGLITLTVGQIYEQQALDGVKEELEALHGVKLIKLFDEKTFYLLCHNYSTHHNCKSYYARFSIQFRANRATKRVFVLNDFMTRHDQGCYEPEIARYLRNNRILNLHYDAIMKLVGKLMQNQCSNKLPTGVMETLCEQEGLDKNFLQQGLTNAQLKRKIKKKFDNTVAEARRRYKNQFYSSDQKMKSQEDDIIEDTPDQKYILQYPIKISSFQETNQHDQEPTQHTLIINKPLNKKIRKLASKNKNSK